MEEKQTQHITINKTEKANSYEFGKAGNRHKIYYETPEELAEHINKLKELGYTEDENKDN
jgi:hypothetical protein